jgi:hypothetical protein
MRRFSPWRVAGLMVVLACVAHLAWSSAMTELLASSYDHRIFDVRRWPSDLSRPAVAQLVAAFAEDRLRGSDRRPSTVFIGSSFTFGYPWQESVVFSTRYAELRPDERVLNISVIGAALEVLNRGVLCGVRDAGQPIDLVILEIPVINAIAKVAEGESADWTTGCAPAARRPRYLGFALERPIGIGWLPFIWDAYAYEKAEENLALAPVPKGYFVRDPDFTNVRARYRQLVAATVAAAKPLAHRLVVFPSPVFLPGVAKLGEDAEVIRVQLTDSIAACREIEGVTCLDPDALYTQPDAYYNMTHLNQRGHQAVANWLAAATAPRE